MNDCCESPMYQRFALFLSIGLVIGVMACGLKGPPVPPQHAPMPGVSDLRGTVEGQTILLTWSGSGAGGTQAINGYDIYSYRSTWPNRPAWDVPGNSLGSVPCPSTGNKHLRDPFDFLFWLQRVSATWSKSGPMAKPVATDRSPIPPWLSFPNDEDHFFL